MRSLLLTALVLPLVACGGSSGQGAASPAHSHAASSTGTPLINVDDMMGLYTQQTVFVATMDHVSAVTLLNHFTRYQIATNGLAQVSIEGASQWLYVLDAGPARSFRLRVFDVSTGSQRAERTGIAGVAADQRALSTAVDGRVLVLKSDSRHAWIDAYEALTLRPLGAVMEKPGCGDRVLASGGRIAIVCLASGEITVGDMREGHALINGPLPHLVAAAMADDGTLYVATADQHLAVAAIGATKLTSLPWPREWSGTVLADGLVVVQGGAAVAIAVRSDEGTWLRVLATTTMTERKSVALAGVPQGGVIALWPFAYYTIDRTIRHVDLNTGLLETMAEVGSGAIPGAVANR
jgi:hypothetical protein